MAVMYCTCVMIVACAVYFDDFVWLLSSCTLVFEVIKYRFVPTVPYVMFIFKIIQSFIFCILFKLDFFSSFIHNFLVRFCVVELADCPFLNAQRNFLIFKKMKMNDVLYNVTCKSEMLRISASYTAMQCDRLLVLAYVICLWRGALWLNDTPYRLVFEKWIGSVPLGTWFLYLSVLYTEPIP